MVTLLQTTKWGTVQSPRHRDIVCQESITATAPKVLGMYSRCSYLRGTGRFQEKSLISFMLLFANLHFDPKADSTDHLVAFPSALTLEGPMEKNEEEGQEEHESGSFLPTPFIKPKEKREERL